MTRSDGSAGGTPRSLSLQVAAAFARNHELRLTVWTRTDRLEGRLLVTLEAWKDQGHAATDSLWLGDGVTAPGTWSKYDLAVRVPADSTIHSIVVTLALAGTGSVWFDDLTLAIDGRRITAIPGTVGTPSRQELAWLAARSTPLLAAGTAAAADSAAPDLAAIGRIVGTARLVGLGESTHGTREFFQQKHRILEYLVRQHGFRVFAIEANQLAVERINRYVEGGDGTAADVMRAMFAVWNTEEVRDLVEWMRQYNSANPGGAVQFAGYDMQDHRTPIDSLSAFLQRMSPPLAMRANELVGEYRQQPRSATPQVADTVRARWSRQADTLWSLVEAEHARWLPAATRRADSVAVEWALQCANLIRQAAGFNVDLFSPQRDSLMAANLDWVMRVLAPGTRVVAWAHDVHVSHGGDSLRSFNGGAQMGAYLARTFGHDYRAFTLLTHDGAYRAARSFTDFTMVNAAAFAAPAGSIEEALHRLPRPPAAVGWVVDLRAVEHPGPGEWLLEARPIRHIGYAAYDYGFDLSAVLPIEFDGVVFIDHTTPARALAR